jgi:hypothetical protein
MPQDAREVQHQQLHAGREISCVPSNVQSSTAGVGQGVLYYAADGNALYKTGSGKVLHGTWTIKDNTSCITWKEQANNPCSRYDKTGDTITVINVATGQVRGKVLKVVDGNPEKIAP